LNSTSTYNGTKPSLDNTVAGMQIIYSPIINTMYTEGLIPPLFSLAILRNVSGPAGYLALGGLPPINFVQNFTSTPILITIITGYPKTYDFYTINICGAILNGKTLENSGGNSIQYIVDSGTTLNYFPTKVAYEINNAFRPRAVYSADDGAFLVNCNAKPPTFGINIAGVVLYTNPLDMILHAGTDAKGKKCVCFRD
jgi:aspergillopepsin I